MKRTLRILPLVAIALAAVVAFSGCGKILEAFFPEETGTGDNSGQNFVILNVRMSTDVEGFRDFSVVARLERVDGSMAPLTRSGFAFAPEGAAEASVSVRFEFLSDGAYKTMAWLDKNGNFEPDPNEPVGSGAGGRSTFMLPDSSNRNSTFDLWIFPPLAGADNKITAKIHVSKDIIGYDAQNAWTMQLNRAGQSIPDSIRQTTASFDPNDSASYLATFIYDGIPDGQYTAMVWLDNVIPNELQDPGELGATISPPDHPGEFPMPLGQQTDVVIQFWIAPPTPPPPASTQIVGFKQSFEADPYTPYLLAASEQKWFYFNTIAGKSYEVGWDDSWQGSGIYTLDAKVTVYHSDQATAYVFQQDSGYYSPSVFTATETGNVYVLVEAYSAGNSGTFGLRVARSVVPLTVGVGSPIYTADQLAEFDTIWFSFNTFGGNYRVAWDDSYQGSGTYTTDVAVSGYYPGPTTNYFTDMDSGWYSPQSLTGVSGVVYIKVREWTAGYNPGTFAIGVYSVP